MARVGIFGGTFNPPHVGHVEAVTQLLNLNLLDEVWVIPNSANPLKVSDDAFLISAQHRYTMTKLAFEGLDRVKVLDWEIHNWPQPSYTIDTLLKAQREYPNHDWFLIIGVDVVSQLPFWRQWQKVIELAHLIVLNRPGFNPLTQVTDLPQALAEKITKQEFNYWHLETGKFLQVVTLLTPEVSSSQIRRRIVKKQFPIQDLPLGVERYIKENKLYQVTSPRFLDPEKLADHVFTALDNKKIQQLILYKLEHTEALADFVLIGHGFSRKQVSEITQSFLEDLKKESGIIPLGVDGIDVGNWVVVDFGSLLVHVFEASSRQLYQLDVLVKNQPGARIVRQN